MATFESHLDITELYAQIIGGDAYDITFFQADYAVLGSPKTRCSIRPVAKHGARKLLSLTDQDTAKMLEAFSTGAEVHIIMKSSGDLKGTTLLYRGFVTSSGMVDANAPTSTNRVLHISLASPECLFPTNPRLSTFCIGKDDTPTHLKSAAALFRSNCRGVSNAVKSDGCSVLTDELMKKLSQNKINVADFTGSALDLDRNDTLVQGLPQSFKTLVDLQNAPVISYGSVESSKIGDHIVDQITEGQQRAGDWDVFSGILSSFYQVPVPLIDTKKGTKKPYLQVKPAIWWSSKVADSIKTSDYTSITLATTRALAGAYRTVAVQYPNSLGLDKPEISEHVVVVIGYDSKGNPVKQVKVIDPNLPNANLKQYLIDGSGAKITSIRKLKLPNWLVHLGTENAGGKELAMYREWGTQLAVAEATSAMLGSPTIELDMRLSSAVKLLHNLGEVVSVEYDADPSGKGRTIKMYGALLSARLRITLEDTRISASGGFVLGAARNKAEQDTFSDFPSYFVNSDIRGV